MVIIDALLIGLLSLSIGQMGKIERRKKLMRLLTELFLVLIKKKHSTSAPVITGNNCKPHLIQ